MVQAFNVYGARTFGDPGFAFEANIACWFGRSPARKERDH